MNTFPGSVYSGDGRRLDRRRPDLTAWRVCNYEHRAVVSRPSPRIVIGEEIGILVERVWVLADDADFGSVPDRILQDALSHINSGWPLLLLARRTEVVGEFRELVLASLMLAEDKALQLMAERAHPAAETGRVA